MIPAICIIATCLIAEGTAMTCAREPESMADTRRALTYADVADLRPTRIDTVEKLACRRIAAEMPIPANWRLVWVEVERPAPSIARGNP